MWVLSHPHLNPLVPVTLFYFLRTHGLPDRWDFDFPDRWNFGHLDRSPFHDFHLLFPCSLDCRGQ